MVFPRAPAGKTTVAASLCRVDGTADEQRVTDQRHRRQTGDGDGRIDRETAEVQRTGAPRRNVAGIMPRIES
jgi:hypothetical protein